MNLILDFTEKELSTLIEALRIAAVHCGDDSKSQTFSHYEQKIQMLKDMAKSVK